MSTPEARLKAHVDAVNECNRLIKLNAPAILEALRPFIGQKVIKATNGELLKKVKATMPRHADFWIQCNAYSIIMQVKTCFSAGDHAIYHSASVYVGKVGYTGGVLESLYDFTPSQYRTGWTPEEVTKLRETLRAAKENVTRANAALFSFGETTR